MNSSKIAHDLLECFAQGKAGETYGIQCVVIPEFDLNSLLGGGSAGQARAWLKQSGLRGYYDKGRGLILQSVTRSQIEGLSRQAFCQKIYIDSYGSTYFSPGF